MRILLVIERRVDRGSIQAVANYVRAGDQLGHTFALYGHPDRRFPDVRFSCDAADFDYAVFLAESSRSWMSGLRMPRLLQSISRDHRAILDADGMYNPIVEVDGYDRNFESDGERKSWRAHFDVIADKVMQPTLEPLERNVLALPFYGYDPSWRATHQRAVARRYDIMHVGHNWWRWQQIEKSLLPAIEEVRDRVGGICFVGSWWDAAPVGAGDLHLDAAFGVDPARLRTLRVEVRPPVPYTDVISVMSEARVNLMTQRPLFRHLRILTSKYFEIFAADTIPLVMLEPDHAVAVYGPAGAELALHDDVAGKLMDVLDKPEKYEEIAQEVRCHLSTHHSYSVRVQQLVAALEA